MNEIIELNASGREIEVITFEIKELCRQSRVTLLVYAVEIGRRLKEAKASLPYGAWGEWLSNEVEFSQSSANNFMRLYDEYGSQKSLVEFSKESQLIGNLPYTKALQLLAVPKEEREAFVEENKVDELSVSELKRVIKERDDALARQKELEDKLSQSDDNDEILALRSEISKLRDDLGASRKNEKVLSEKIKESVKNPKIPPAMLKKIKKEAEESAKKTAEAQVKSELEDARKRAESAEAYKEAAVIASENASRRFKELERQLKYSDPDVIAFRTLFTSMQHTVSELEQLISRIKENDSVTALKLCAALKTFISDVVGKELCIPEE